MRLPREGRRRAAASLLLPCLLLLAPLPRAGGAPSAAERGLARFEAWFSASGGSWAPGVAAAAAPPACAQSALARRAEVRVVTRARVPRETVRAVAVARPRVRARACARERSRAHAPFETRTMAASR